MTKTKKPKKRMTAAYRRLLDRARTFQRNVEWPERRVMLRFTGGASAFGNTDLGSVMQRLIAARQMGWKVEVEYAGNELTFTYVQPHQPENF